MLELLGIHVSSESPLFLAVLAIHIPCGMICTFSGIVAMTSKKQPGRHPTFGTIYYWCLTVLCMSATILSIMRWAENYHLFILGLLSLTAATLGRTAHRRLWPGWVRLHIGGMGLSYVLMLTAFYVDNGRNIPLWKELPPLAFWVLPGAIGLPLIIHALLRHPLVHRPPRVVPGRSG